MIDHQQREIPRKAWPYTTRLAILATRRRLAKELDADDRAEEEFVLAKLQNILEDAKNR